MNKLRLSPHSCSSLSSSIFCHAADFFLPLCRCSSLSPFPRPLWANVSQLADSFIWCHRCLLLSTNAETSQKSRALSIKVTYIENVGWNAIRLNLWHFRKVRLHQHVTALPSRNLRHAGADGTRYTGPSCIYGVNVTSWAHPKPRDTVILQRTPKTLFSAVT